MRKKYDKHVSIRARESLKDIYAPELICVFDPMKELAVVLAEVPTEDQRISDASKEQPSDHLADS